MNTVFKHSLFLSIFLLAGLTLSAQQTVVKGTVTDAKTGQPIPYAIVNFPGSDIGTVCDANGQYVLETTGPYDTLQVSFVGYATQEKKIKPGQSQTIDIKLLTDIKELQDVTVVGQKQKYRSKGNPAVELIRNVIEHKRDNRKENFDYYEYQQYQKIEIAVSHLKEGVEDKKIFRKFQVLFDNKDTAQLDNTPILPLFLKEEMSINRFRKKPRATKQIITAEKTVEFAGYVDNKGLDTYMKYLYHDINIYDENITILTNQFTSPIANVAPAFYQYAISDTLIENGVRMAKIDFFPRNPADLLLQGYMYVSLDTNFVVMKIVMGVDKHINMNWVKDLNITQDFIRDGDLGVSLVMDQFSADFGFSKKDSTMGFFGQRSVFYSNFVINKIRPDEDYDGEPVVYADSAALHTDLYWEKNRPIALSKSEAGVYTTMDSLNNIPAFKHSLNLTLFILSGYAKITPWFEMGPVGAFYSFNPVEGFRLRVGGRTPTTWNKKISFESYVAYGFLDERWKYYFGTTYSLSKRSIYEFPVRSLKLSYQRDTKIPGQENQFVQEASFFLSFKRGPNSMWLYNDIYKVEYFHEFRNHLSFSVGYKNWTQRAAGSLHFNKEDYNDPTTDIDYVRTAEVSVLLRWAPHEQFYQGKTYRTTISYKEPVFTFKYIDGSEALGGQYNYHNFSASFYKRFYLSPIGYTDITLSGGKLIGQVPFPLLEIHRANQTYAYYFQSYNMMNFLEFVSDSYVSLYLDHWFNGFFFNKIPLFKKLKWREVASLRLLEGTLSGKNDPAKTEGLFAFPVTPEGTPITYALGSKPYIEAGVGVVNIFKFLRLDLVRRFTYLDHPDISKWAVLASVKFDF
jgi:hypothetical protein